MSVELTASAELIDAIGEEQFATYLRMFNATIISSRPADPISAWIIYILDVPDAPADAVRVNSVWQRHAGGTVSLLSLDWYDANGRLIHTDTWGQP